MENYSREEGSDQKGPEIVGSRKVLRDKEGFSIQRANLVITLFRFCKHACLLYLAPCPVSVNRQTHSPLRNILSR